MMSARAPAKEHPRWMLVVSTHPYPYVLALTEDCAQLAKERGWIILATESDIFQERI